MKTGLTPGNDINVLGIKNNLNIANKILIISGLIFLFIAFLFIFKKDISTKRIKV